MTSQSESVLCLLRKLILYISIRHNTLFDGDIEVCVSYERAGKWIRALRSPTYCQRTLHTVTQYHSTQLSTVKVTDILPAQSHSTKLPTVKVIITLPGQCHSTQLSTVKVTNIVPGQCHST